MVERDDILNDVNAYYTDKVEAHGASPQGVDWNGVESQELRFQMLLKIVEDVTNPFTLLDYGCGYGATFGFMQSRYTQFNYTGFDISESMIAEARKLNPAGPTHWTTERNNTLHDYIVASGLFNVRLKVDDATWWNYVVSELDWINAHAVKGFAFNMLTSYADAERMRDYLYYANPVMVFDHCKHKYSKFVALLHDYPLYEFTVLVRKA